MSSVKKWIAHSGGFAKGAIHLNKGAADMVRSGKAVSILPVGATAVDGDFEHNDIVRILDEAGNEIGVGRIGYDSDEARKVLGKRDCKPLVHYDYLYTE